VTGDGDAAGDEAGAAKTGKRFAAIDSQWV
jgi:hypothetical protein